MTWKTLAKNMHSK